MNFVRENEDYPLTESRATATSDSQLIAGLQSLCRAPGLRILLRIPKAAPLLTNSSTDNVYAAACAAPLATFHVLLQELVADLSQYRLGCKLTPSRVSHFVRNRGV